MKYLLYYRLSTINQDGKIIRNHQPKSIIFDDFDNCFDEYKILYNKFPMKCKNGNKHILSEISIFKEGIYGTFKDYI